MGESAVCPTGSTLGRTSPAASGCVVGVDGHWVRHTHCWWPRAVSQHRGAIRCVVVASRSQPKRHGVPELRLGRFRRAAAG